MWAGLRFLNGYSPIRGAGVGRALAFYTHGEMDPAMAAYLLGYEAGPNGLLKTIGVDGTVIGTGTEAPTPPSPEWEQVSVSDEGRVFERRGGPLPAVRSAKVLDLFPNEKWGWATVALREDSRSRLVADVRVAKGEGDALLLISRPFFDGYRATVEGKSLLVQSYRGLIPILRLPAGTDGRLTIVYRPWWLVWGGTAALCSALLGLVAGWRALRSWRGVH